MLVPLVASVAGQPKLERRVAVLPPTPEGPVQGTMGGVT